MNQAQKIREDLKFWLYKNRISHERVAEEVGSSKGYISKLLNSKSDALQPTVLKILEHYGFQVEVRGL